MHITVNVYAYLRRYMQTPETPAQGTHWEMPEHATVGEVVERLRLPEKVRVTVLLNNNSVDQKTVLKEGDIVHILPQMGGG